MNGLIVASIVINAVVTFGASQDVPFGLAAVMGLFVVLSAIGAGLITAGKKRVGAIMVVVGCVAFVPIGLIGVFGARRVLDQLARERFAAESATS